MCSACTGAIGPIGGDLCGVVTEIGSEVAGFEVGQRVMGFMQGAFASRINVPALLLAPVPRRYRPGRPGDHPGCRPDRKALLRLGQAAPGTGRSSIPPVAAWSWRRSSWPGTAARRSSPRRVPTSGPPLREMGVEYVYDSRTTDFADQILADTDGEGVDVVLNSLTNEGFVEASGRPPRADGSRRSPSATSGVLSRWRGAPRHRLRDHRSRRDDRERPAPHPAADEQGVAGIGRAAVGAGARRGLPADRGQVRAFRRMQQARHIGEVVLQMPKPLAPRGRSGLPGHRWPRRAGSTPRRIWPNWAPATSF